MTLEIGSIDGPPAFARVFGVSRETVARLEVYEALLRTWQRTINLVAPSTLDSVWHRHFADSAQLFGLVAPLQTGSGWVGQEASGRQNEDGAAEAAGADRFVEPTNGSQIPKTWLDLGSGGGFPGLVLAILLAEKEPAARMTLVESDSRKAAFLGEVVRKTGLTVEIRAERSEKFATQAKSHIKDVITARALAPLPKLLGLALPYFSPQTVALFPKGRGVESEVREAEREFRFDAALVPSLTNAGARIVIVRNLALKTEG